MAAAVVWAAACGDADPDVTGPTPVPNGAPQAVGTIPEQTPSVGETATVDLSSYFSDPDGDALSYTAASSNAGVAGVSVSGSSVVVTALARGVVTVTVTARDPQGLAAQQRFQVTVPNRAPEAVDAIPAQTVFAGWTASVDASLYFRDPDGDPLTYTATSSNPGVATTTVAAATITLRAVTSGVATVTVSASDPEGGAARQTVQVIVPNREPEAVGTIPERTLSVGETAMVDVSSYFSDPDGDTLSYTAASSNAGVAEASVSGSSVVIAALARGVVTVTVTARDPQGLLAQQRFQLTVPNRAPEAVDAIPVQTVFAGRTASVDASIYFRDPDGDPLTYTATSSNPDVTTTTVAAATITIRAVTSGVATITVNASDPEGGAAQQSVQVAVPNRAPEAVREIPARTVSAGERAAVDMSPYFSDPDGDKLSYTAASSNAGVAVGSVSGDSVVVTSLATGVAIVTVTARDRQGLAAQQRFQVTVANQAPEAVGEIPAQAVSAGETATVDVSPYFREPDGDALSYTASSSNAGVAGADVSGSSVVVSALAGGMATVTVTARDPGGLSASSSFSVTVETAEGRFQIELIFATSMTRTQRAAFVRAAERWMTILAPTELPDARVNRTLDCGDDPRFERYVETIDELMIVAAVAEIDGPGGTLAQANWCWARSGTLLPFYGRMEFDAADLDRLEQRGSLEETILHEMGHVLGIGTIWDRLGLLRNPASDTELPDTHFTGRLAIEAFNEAGGTGYRGAKVPVENMGGPGSRNGHWREIVLATELMTPYTDPGVPEPLSAITIQSLADLGYEVDSTVAEPYRLPGADAARAIDPDRLIPYGDDIWRGPVVIVDRDGRIVRVIPGSSGGDRRRF
ncbi:Ig-like domain-containing protein [Candidatus Palauibacter sp.]|uniref:Ig-like domain-containing protein n=1 Tax=Candidatus Palauibacter sp. TaxID=3101350 RepID=UPI003B519982